MNPKLCPFMRENGPLLRGIVSHATTEQREAVHKLPKEYKRLLADRGPSPLLSAWYIVRWLQLLGQNPAHWSRDRWRGRVVPESDVLRQVLIGRKRES